MSLAGHDRLTISRNVNCPYFRVWHELTVRGVAQVRQLSGANLPRVCRRQTGEF